MLNSIIAGSLKHRFFVVVAAALLLAGGALVIPGVPVDVFPDLTAPSVTVLTETRGMAPEEVELLVTFPLESALNGASGVRRVRSVSAAGISVIWVEFLWGEDVYRARQVVAERGMFSTRVADIATATNVSGGLIHYHFATKDILMAEMLRASSLEERLELERMATSPGTAADRLDQVIRYYIPRARDDQSWKLWIEAWAAGLRSPELREILAALS